MQLVINLVIYHKSVSLDWILSPISGQCGGRMDHLLLRASAKKARCSIVSQLSCLQSKSGKMPKPQHSTPVICALLDWHCVHNPPLSVTLQSERD